LYPVAGTEFKGLRGDMSPPTIVQGHTQYRFPSIVRDKKNFAIALTSCVDYYWIPPA